MKDEYREHYHLIDGKAMPLWIIETVRKWYKQSHPESYKVHDFRKATRTPFPNQRLELS